MATSYVVFTRHPSGRLVVLTNGSAHARDWDVAEFATEEDARRCAEQNPACRAWGCEIVPLAGIEEEEI